jgi:predicted peptidase
MKHLFFICLFFFFLSTPAAVSADAPPAGEFLNRTAVSGETEYAYRVYLPAHYDPAKKYPVVLFLHGSDERGDDNKVQIESGLANIIEIGARLSVKEFSSFIGVFPQAGKEKFWTGETADRAVGALDRTIDEFNADPDRIYLTGFSMGGYGSWYLAAKYSGKFAAFAPIGGHIIPVFLQPPAKFPPFIRDFIHSDMLPLLESEDPYTDFAEAVGKTPVWMFHGSADEQVPVGDARKMFAALKKVNRAAQFTEYAGDGHFIYHKAYTEKGFWKWLFNQRLKPAKVK